MKRQRGHECRGLAALGALIVAAGCGEILVSPSRPDGGAAVDGGPVGAVDAGATDPFALSRGPARALVRQGASVEIEVSVDRESGFEAPVRVEPGALPRGVTAEALIIGGGDRSGSLVLSAAAGGLAGDYWLARVDADGALDDTFGAEGIAVTDFDDGFDVAFGLIATGDTILSVGVTHPADVEGARLSVARHDSNGAADPTFGLDGKVLTDIRFDTAAAGAAVVDAGGRIVVVGEFPGVASSHLAVVRLLPDGTPDAAFADAGRAAVTFPLAPSGSTGAYGVALDGDGRIPVSGEIGPSGDQTLAVCRLWP
jgi:uncharacterized delta-60 repeat protein